MTDSMCVDVQIIQAEIARRSPVRLLKTPKLYHSHVATILPLETTSIRLQSVIQSPTPNSLQSYSPLRFDPIFYSKSTLLPSPPSRNSPSKSNRMSHQDKNSNFGRTVNATEISKQFTTELQSGSKLVLNSSLQRPPKLIGFLASSDEPSIAYAEWTAKACAEVGIEFELRKIGLGNESGGLGTVAGGGMGEVESKILEANMDDSVDGIMVGFFVYILMLRKSLNGNLQVYYPLFKTSGGRQDQYIQQVVAPLKDVEGLGLPFLFALYHNIRQMDPRTLALCHFANPSLGFASLSPLMTEKEVEKVKPILPCTPLAIVKTLEYVGVYNQILPYGQRAYGKTITVINRSEVVGRPLAALLANDGARVFVSLLSLSCVPMSNECIYSQ